MEGIKFVRRNHIFYWRKELAEKLHKTVPTETDRMQADLFDSPSKAAIMN